MKKIAFLLLILLFVFPNNLNEQHRQGQAIQLNSNDGVSEFDVIVIGGEPEGIAAALSAARNGANTLLIEHRDGLGGLFTYAKMNVLDFPHGINNRILKTPIFSEWHNMIGNGKSFEIEKAKQAFFKMVLNQKNLSLLLNTTIEDIEIEQGNKISTINIKNGQNNYHVKAATYIDATQDAEFAANSGVPYYLGAEDVGYDGRQMAVTLMIHLKDVDWSKIYGVAKNLTFGEAKVTDEAAWGFVKLRERYKPNDPNIRLRGLNLIRNKEGYYINALQIFGVNGLDEASKQQGIERGKQEIANIVKWLQANFPGFEHAKVASYPSELYVRETRHIKSLYQLPVSDLWENKYHDDTIAYGGYPSDIQATTVNDPGAVVVNPKQYGIPFRSLVPQRLTNLLVVGRSAGYSSLAQGSVRIVATGMATGEAAGTASALAAAKNIDFHSMANSKDMITNLQHKLKQQGLNVERFKIPFPYENKWYYPAIRELLNHRALFGGYNNDILENEIADNHFFSLLLLHMYRAKLSQNPSYEENISFLTEYNLSHPIERLTVNEVKAIIDGLPYKHFSNAYLIEANKLDGHEQITRESLYIIVGKLFDWL
ncbi:FAD-dependent oxidoreductase [Calidifontibacillus oryziterrae]|uniref:FAD-dependent oxidoreductase n=1 Tax=Calidifontibacillus oryziterrae TaxID=1191699 RepID=UPI00030B8F58|nr:FAD-dependent oxidoreductase [Calidifontibacillus oryziterrae]